jgi:hypothetical protein
MTIQDEMYKLIEQEINQTVATDKQRIIVDYDKAKQVARMLTSLSTDTNDADSLTNQYIANIKNICNSQIERA